ncbi:hypothetical protein [Arsenophonus endosymbiont of Aleurodicus floccissimus]|uniref:hypothetical protein n=1 Tax=Arsenophonus endosymbiont of Aleurodicus floccissimus TaxID=2152761 RepID=UPI001EDF9A5C|nr:hypothetical protein [Arsenophonus endosymbiont of Aleurodicus floccissimus]
MTIPEGKSEPRYTLNGAYELSESPASIIEHMHRCIGAEPTYIAGKHGIIMWARTMSQLRSKLSLIKLLIR